MGVFITGGSGFVGRRVIAALRRRGCAVRALVNRSPIEGDGVESFRGGLFDDDVLDEAMHGCSAVIHLVGIIRETPKSGQTFERIHFQGATRVMAAAKRNGIARFVHMSAIGARLDSASDYARTKARAEEALKESGLAYTIFRPSIIHGAGGEFLRMMTEWAAGRAVPYFFMPYFGTGLFGQTSRLVQPVFVEDVARAFVEALERDDWAGRTIDLAGPERMSWPQMYGIVSHALRGKRKATLGIPRWYASLLTRLLPAPLLPFNRSQVVMAGEDNIADIDAIEQTLGWRPQSLENSLEVGRSAG